MDMVNNPSNLHVKHGIQHYTSTCWPDPQGIHHTIPTSNAPLKAHATITPHRKSQLVCRSRQRNQRRRQHPRRQPTVGLTNKIAALKTQQFATFFSNAVNTQSNVELLNLTTVCCSKVRLGGSTTSTTHILLAEFPVYSFTHTYMHSLHTTIHTISYYWGHSFYPDRVALGAPCSCRLN